MQCEKLNRVLIARYDIDLMACAQNRDHLRQVYEHYREQCSTLKRYLGESIESPAYSKAYLISEAAILILREIAPKRTKRKKGA